MKYSHTQQGSLDAILWGVFGFLFVVGLFFDQDPIAQIVTFASAGLMALFALMFGNLTVRDEGDVLGVRFGPLPVFRTRIPYDRITAIEPSRTTFLDGWGIHWIPFRGTTFNLWGFDCVKLEVGRRTIRIGTDDVESLVAFLRKRFQEPSKERLGVMGQG